MIEVKDLEKHFGDIHAVRGITFSIKRGEVVGLLGPNGAGKSTTMRMLTGFLKPDSGSITIGDLNVATDPIATRSVIGYLPESAPLYLEMEVTDFLFYVAELRALPKSERIARLKEVIETCGLGDVVGRPIGELSKGYRQRVGLAAAMLHHPNILILDEPTSGLDPNQIQDIRDVIRSIGKERTVILSTHILQEVEAVCDRAIIVNKGSIVGEGSINELMAQSHGNVRYRLLVNAAENALRAQSNSLHGANLLSCNSSPDNWNEAVFETDKGVDGEAFFEWSVLNGWRLRELHREEASLEDVFRELTQ